ncbi:Recombination protein RecR [uncultured bacterium]|nr:Recombination protein RecR [uncultured bacterium]
MSIAEPLQRAIDEFSRFPGIGRKTAQRLALFLLNRDSEDVNRFIQSVVDLKSKMRHCSLCFNLSEHEICSVCENPKRDRGVICVVEEVNDVMAIEKTHEYSGLYHVLGGVLSPLSGIGPDDLHLKELLSRVETGEVKEVILALNPDTEGETTTLYLAKMLKGLDVPVSRIARGIPIGGELEFIDEATIGRAMSGRMSLL